MLTRIEVIRTRYPHWGAHTGIGQFLSHLTADRFAIRHWVASDGDDDFPLRNWAVRGWLRRVVQRKGMAWYKLSDVRAEARVLRRSVRGRVDIVHYLDGEHSAQYLPLLRRMVGVSWPRLVATFHQPPNALSGLVRRDVVRGLDYVTVVVPQQAAFFEQFLPRERVHVILHGVDTEFFRPADKPVPKDGYLCLTVGHYFRDFATLRRVARLLAATPDIQFHVVSTRETGVENVANVTVHRNISDHSLLSLYQLADVLVLPLLDCTANNALLEALACGLPVITTDLPSIHAYASADEATFVRDNNVDDFGAAIMALRQSPERRQRMGLAARHRAEQLSWANVATAYARLYDEAMTSGR